MENMLNNSGLNTENYDATLIGWASQNLQSNLPLGAEGLTYCAGKEARERLIEEYNWNITGDMLEEGCEVDTSRPFVTTWVTDDGTITIPTSIFFSEYDYSISWKNLTNPGVGEGETSGQTGNYTVTGLENGSIYEVSISGTFPHMGNFQQQQHLQKSLLLKLGEIMNGLLCFWPLPIALT